MAGRPGIAWHAGGNHGDGIAPIQLHTSLESASLGNSNRSSRGFHKSRGDSHSSSVSDRAGDIVGLNLCVDVGHSEQVSLDDRVGICDREQLSLSCGVCDGSGKRLHRGSVIRHSGRGRLGDSVRSTS